MIGKQTIGYKRYDYFNVDFVFLLTKKNSSSMSKKQILLLSCFGYICWMALNTVQKEK